MELTKAQVKYHFNSGFARIVRWLAQRPRTSNWCVTIGRHTFVSLNHITGHSRAHEFAHTLQQEKEGWRFWWRYHREQRWKGYRLNHYEVSARLYANLYEREFGRVGAPPKAL